MRKIIKKGLIGLCFIAFNCQAFDWSLLNEGAQLLKDTGISDTTVSSSLDKTDIISGLKAALSRGVEKSIKKLGQKNGFLRDKKLKINLPPTINKMAQIAKKLGQGHRVNDFVKSMNHAAEAAVPHAAKILADSVQKMSVEDGLKILNGSDTAATDYFKKVSSKQLTKQFLPIVKTEMARVEVTKKYKMIADQSSGLLKGVFNAKPFDLDRYVTSKALDGLYQYIALEEKKIRADPIATGSNLLIKVFGK